jgi:hypothetical protein
MDMVHVHDFFSAANNGRYDNNNRGGPEPQVKEEQFERSKRCTGICTGRYFILFPSTYNSREIL